MTELTHPRLVGPSGQLVSQPSYGSPQRRVQPEAEGLLPEMAGLFWLSVLSVGEREHRQTAAMWVRACAAAGRAGRRQRRLQQSDGLANPSEVDIAPRHLHGVVVLVMHACPVDPVLVG